MFSSILTLVYFNLSDRVFCCLVIYLGHFVASSGAAQMIRGAVKTGKAVSTVSDVSLESGMQAFMALREEAKKGGVQDLSMDEINLEISRTRLGQEDDE